VDSYNFLTEPHEHSVARVLGQEVS
jgi:hypothetical protein